jgi:hypothetical protein
MLQPPRLKSKRFYPRPLPVACVTPVLGKEIVKATGDMAFGFGGRLNDPSAVGQMMSGGLDGKSTLHDVQMNVSGLQATSNLLGSNPYFRAVSAESAKNVLGGGASGTSMMAASKSSLSDLIGGSPMLSAANISEDQRKGMLRDRLGSLMGAFLTNSNDKNTAGLRGALSGNGGDIIGALKGGKGQLNDQFALALSSSTDIPFEQAVGMARDITGMDKVRGGTNTYGRNSDATAESTVRAQQEVLHTLYQKEITMRTDYLNSIRDTGTLVQTMARAPDFQSFETFMVEFVAWLQNNFTRKGARTSSNMNTSSGSPFSTNP